MKTAIIRTVFPRLGMMPPFRLHRPPRVLKASQSYPASQKAVPLLFFFLSAWTLKRCRLCFAVLFCLKKRRLKSRKATGKISAACRKGTNLLHFAQPRVRKKKKRSPRGTPLPSARVCDTTQHRPRQEDASAIHRGVFPPELLGWKRNCAPHPESLRRRSRRCDRFGRHACSTPGPLAVLETPSQNPALENGDGHSGMDSCLNGTFFCFLCFFFFNVSFFLFFLFLLHDKFLCAIIFACVSTLYKLLITQYLIL